MEVDYSLLIGLLGIATAIYFGLYFGLRGIRTSFEGSLRKIEEHMEPIKRIEDIAVRLEERIYAPRFFPESTVEGVLKNIGKVKVTAEPGKERTKYYVEIGKPIMKEGLMTKRSVETWLFTRERELFREGAPVVAVIDPRRAVFDLPSADPKICSQYITLLLKWLDSEYWSFLTILKDYENITF